MKVSFPNTYGLALPDENAVQRFQQKHGFSDAYRDFLLTQNGFCFRRLAQDSASESILEDAPEPDEHTSDLSELYGLGPDGQAESEESWGTLFSPAFFPIGVGYGGNTYVEILAGRYRWYIASLDHELHASSDTLEEFLEEFELDDVDSDDPDALADALCDDDVGLVWLHARSLADFLAHCVHCDDDHQGFVVDAISQPANQSDLNDLSLPVRRFGDIKHLLPEDCWAVTRNARQGEFEDESVLVHEGSLTLSALDLDDVLGTGKHIFLVFVQGDLHVDGPIFNDDTDGATGLIVGGNLSCRNAAVGGQQIYVTGNLDVGELFWGDYNHGELIVAGNATAPMAVTTNQYDLTVRGERAFARWILDEEPGGEDWRFDDIEALGEYIDPDFIFEDDDDLSLDRDEIIAAMQENRRVVQPQATGDVADLIDRFFPDRAISYQNIQRIALPGWVTADEEGEVQGQEEFWVDDICCRVALVPDGKNPLETSLYFQLEESLGVMILLTNTHQDASAWAAEHADKEDNGQYLSIGWRDIEADGLWALLDEQAPPAAHTLLAEGWRLALTFAAAQERIRQEIPPAALRELLALPLVEPYDDFEDDDRNGLWVGNTYCSFNQENVDEDELPMLRVTVEQDDTRFYYFEVISTADGGEKVDIRFSPDLDSDDDTYPGQTGGHELDRALRMFGTAKRNLLRANEELLAGSFFTDDSFARKHWIRKGYMKKRLP